jgi:hypothetical protein
LFLFAGEAATIAVGLRLAFCWGERQNQYDEALMMGVDLKYFYY